MIKTVNGVMPVRIPAALASNDPADSLTRLAQLQSANTSLTSVALGTSLPVATAEQPSTLLPAVVSNSQVLRSQPVVTQASAAANSPANASALTKQVRVRHYTVHCSLIH